MQISTDYVFDGENKPYKVNQRKSPLTFMVIQEHLRKIIS